MHAELTPLDGAKAIGITFTDKPVTAWGGLALGVEAHRVGGARHERGVAVEVARAGDDQLALFEMAPRLGESFSARRRGPSCAFCSRIQPMFWSIRPGSALHTRFK